MTETKYSEFTLNFNPRFRRKGDEGTDDKSKTDRKPPPTLVGKAKVIDSDGTETEFEAAALGAQRGEDRRPGLLQRHLEPQGPRLARAPDECHDSTARSETPSKASSSRSSATCACSSAPRAEIQAAKANGKTLPRFYGHGLVLLPSGPRYIDLSAWYRPEHGFYSGNAPLHDPAAARAARAAKPAAEPT